MDTFWQLLRESVLIQGTVTLGLVFACIYMVIAGQPIPEGLYNMTLLTLGFYFGAKSTISSSAAYRDSINMMSKTLVAHKEGC